MSDLDLASQEDRQWFDDHPNRIFRLRFATEGNPGGAGHGCLVLVFCCTDEACAYRIQRT
jgi:hypothetical protein